MLRIINVSFLQFLFIVCTTTLTQAWFLPQGYGSSDFGFNGFIFNGLGLATTSEFKCRRVGRYPDPYDCRNFYDCYSGGTYNRYRCGPFKRYSVNRQGCINASSVACYNLAFSCSSTGDMGAWPGDASIFYICEVSGTSGRLVPSLLRCPQGLLFNGEICA